LIQDPTQPGRPVVMLDVDNTLLDNDRVQRDLGDKIEALGGRSARERYWSAYEALRAKLDYSDYLGAVRELAHGQDGTLDAQQIDEVMDFLLEYPFRERLYPGALEAIDWLRTWAVPVIVSDGDDEYQPRKIRRSGLADAVEGRVLIYLHKEKMLDEIDRLYPSDKRAMVEDKLRILAAMKERRGESITTVFVRQGHYAHDPAVLAQFPPADLALERIGDLPKSDLRARLQAP
jgi:phosphoserine phosphatase